MVDNIYSGRCSDGFAYNQKIFKNVNEKCSSLQMNPSF